MRKETDLARVKMIAHVLLDMPIAETSFSPAIVSHPFTSTGVTAAQNEDGNITVVDLLNNKEDYETKTRTLCRGPVPDHGTVPLRLRRGVGCDFPVICAPGGLLPHLRVPE